MAHREVWPFARRFVDAFPGRVLWGIDRLHPNQKDRMPDDVLLVDNSMRLYWPEER